MSVRASLLAGLFAACCAASGAAAAAGAKPLPALDRVMTLPVPRVVRDLPMTDHTGAARRLGDLAGKPALVFFGFTHCPEVCPATIQKLALLKSSRAADLADVRVVLVSVDGERDTPEVLKAFLARFSSEFVGLTAPAAQTRELALSFSAPFFKDAPRDGTYNVQHSTRVYVLDKHGRLRAEMYDASADAIVGIAKALLAE
jgi:protein SCO1/2